MSTQTTREITQTTPVPNLPPKDGDRYRHLSKFEMVPPRRGRLGKNHNEPGFKLGEHIRKLIAIRGMTREQVCAESGLSPHGLNHIIGGYVKYPSTETLLGLAKALNVTTLELLAQTGAGTEDDIRAYVAQNVQGDTLSSDVAWTFANNQVQALPPEQRKILLQTFLVLISSHQSYCQAAD